MKRILHMAFTLSSLRIAQVKTLSREVKTLLQHGVIKDESATIFQVFVFTRIFSICENTK